MRILITTQVFPPEIHPSARIVWELARSLSDSGHEVMVAAGYPHHPHGKILGGYKKRGILRETVDGVRVVRGWHITSTSDAFPARALVYVSQALGTAMAALLGIHPEVIINYGPPLVGPALSVLLARLFRSRHVPVIYDLYPDTAIELGVIASGAVARFAKAIEIWVYRNSDRIVVLSEGFRRTLVAEKGVPEGKVRVIPVWIDPDGTRRIADTGSWRQRIGISPEMFVVLYAGTIGLVSGAEIMVKVARNWADQSDVVFLFVGEGKAKERVRAEAESLPNVRLFDFQPKEQLEEMLSSADVGIMTLLPGRGRTSVPSKVFGYMAVEVPVLASCDTDSDSAALIRDSGCGIVVPPGDVAEISDALRQFRAAPDYRLEAGKRGRKYLETYHSREAGIKAFRSLIGEFEQTGDKGKLSHRGGKPC